MPSRCARAAAFLLSLSVIGIPALSAEAATANGVSIIVMSTPPGLGVNETFGIDIEVRLWRNLVDAGTIGVRADWDSNISELVNVSTGRYHATYTISARDALAANVQLEVQASVAGWYGSVWGYYAVRGRTGYSSWSSGVTVRIVGGDSPDSPAGPGSIIQFEARYWKDGVLADPGRMTGYLSTNIFHGSNDETAIVWQATATGVYRFNATVPSSLQAPAQLSASAWAYPATSDPWPPSLGGDSAWLTVFPLRATADVVNISDTSVTLRVLAGDRSGPEVGANVAVVPRGRQLPSSCANASASTDAAGEARLTLACPRGTVARFEINVSNDGRSLRMQLGLQTVQMGNDCIGCFPPGLWVEARNETIDLRPGQSVLLNFTAHSADRIYPRADLIPIVVRTSIGRSSLLENLTADDFGNFTIPYAIPEDWLPGEALRFVFVGPAGDSAEAWVTFGMSSPRSPALRLTASQTSAGPIHIDAQFVGQEHLSDASVEVTVTPGSDMFGLNRATGTPLRFSIPRSGQGFAGDITLPSWYPESDVIVGIQVNNVPPIGVADRVSVTNLTVVHYAPASATGTNPNDPGGIGPQAPFLLIVAALVAATSAFVLVLRRRRA